MINLYDYITATPVTAYILIAVPPSPFSERAMVVKASLCLTPVLGEGQGGRGQFRFYDFKRSLQANGGRQFVAPTFAVKLRFTRVAGGVDPYGMVCTETVINMLISLNGREEYARRGLWRRGPVLRMKYSYIE